MIPEFRQVVDARTQSAPAVITTARPVSASAATATPYVRPARVVHAAPVRVLSQATTQRQSSGRGRLVAVVLAGALADVAVLGTAGHLFAQSAAGRQLAALVLLAVAVGVGVLLVALSRGTVHCPGCPR